jgi:chromosome segregation ATPase
MTSATTSASKGRAPARLAASSLLALAMMLGACSAPQELQDYAAADLQQYIADAQEKAQAVEDDLQRLESQVDGLPAALRTDVVDAVASAEAATEEARSALELAAKSDEGAAAALADAQNALDAASAELRYVIGQAEAAGLEVTEGLEHLLAQIDALRGETSRAGG